MTDEELRNKKKSREAPTADQATLDLGDLDAEGEGEGEVRGGASRPIRLRIELVGDGVDR